MSNIDFESNIWEITLSISDWDEITTEFFTCKRNGDNTWTLKYKYFDLWDQESSCKKVLKSTTIEEVVEHLRKVIPNKYDDNKTKMRDILNYMEDDGQSICRSSYHYEVDLKNLKDFEIVIQEALERVQSDKIFECVRGKPTEVRDEELEVQELTSTKRIHNKNKEERRRLGWFISDMLR
jgi:hypothetical protein